MTQRSLFDRPAGSGHAAGGERDRGQAASPRPAWPAGHATGIDDAGEAVPRVSPTGDKRGLPPRAIAAGVAETKCRCGSREFVDVAIHAGRSVRRDCLKCNRFHEFTKWYEKRNDPAG